VLIALASMPATARLFVRWRSAVHAFDVFEFPELSVSGAPFHIRWQDDIADFADRVRAACLRARSPLTASATGGVNRHAGAHIAAA
jgi:hypothetical protein